MKYLMVEPRILMVSRDKGSLPFGVILTVRSAVFICGVTEAMVPWTMVPWEDVSEMRDLTDGDTRVPFLSSMVTVSLVHFMRKLGHCQLDIAFN
jgi:hypothetical protein